jgi:hypothetical protein
MKSKLEIYALAICFASMVCLVVAAAIAGYAMFQITLPDITINAYKYEQLSSNEQYWRHRLSSSSDEKACPQKPTDAEITKLRNDALVVEMKSEQRDGFQTLIKCLMFLLFGGIVLAIHWRIARNARGS